MSRKKLIKKNLPELDFKYNNILVTLLINKILKNGKKSLAKKIIYNTFNYIFNKINKNPILIFEKAIRNISPRIKLQTKFNNNNTQNIPVLLNLYTSTNIAISWLIEISNKKSGKKMYLKLATEILDSYKGIGTCIKKKEETHKMAKANKAFLFKN